MIKFLKLNIEGFCSISQFELELDSPGITVIRGFNGQGKSSLFSALVWGLYGKNLKGISDVNTWDKFRLDTYKGTKVEVYFESPKGLHKIIRCQNYKAKVGNGLGNNRLIYLIDTEESPIKGKLELQNQISRDLGMSYNLFINSVMFGQGLTRLIQESGADQKKLFEEIFDLNYLTIARNIASNRMNELSPKISKAQYELNYRTRNKQEIKQNIQEIKSSRDSYQDQIKQDEETYKSQIKKLEKSLKEFEDLPKKIEKTNRDFEKLEKSLREYKQYIANPDYKKVSLEELVDKVIKLIEEEKIKASLTVLRDIKSSIVKTREYQDKISQLNDERYKLSQIKHNNLIKDKDRIHIESQIKQITNSLKRIDKNTPDYDSMISRYKENLKKIKRESKEFRNEAESLTKEYELVKWAYDDPLGNNGIKAYLFESSLGLINELLKSYSNILGFNIYFGMDLSTTRKDFVVAINLNGIDVFYEELSGGQKQLVNLAMAFAMNQALSRSKGLNIAFLDEIFESLSEDNIGIVIDLIKKIYQNKTLFLITHQESLPIPNSKTLRVKNIKGLSHYEYK